MLLTRKNPRGGRTLTTYPLVEEQRSGNLGYKLGYCDGCGEAIVVRMTEAAEIADRFVGGVNLYHKKVLDVQKELKPKIPISVRLAKFLLSNREEYKNVFEERIV